MKDRENFEDNFPKDLIKLKQKYLKQILQRFLHLFEHNAVEFQRLRLCIDESVSPFEQCLL